MGEAIPFSSVSFGPADEAAVVDALRSSWVSGGPYVDQLEKRMARLLGVEHAVAVSNGTTAIELALRGYGIGSGDEVLLPGYAFVAAASMVCAVGASPVFVDIDEESWGYDFEALQRSIGPRTKAIVAVHAYGPMDRVDRLRVIADAHGLRFIEDAAEATFSRLHGRAAGSFGHVGTFSFHATKTITTGEGGMVVTGDAELAERMRLIRSHGRDPRGRKYWHTALGSNFRLSNVLAALGCSQLDRLDDILSARRRIVAEYRAMLQELPAVRLQPVLDGCEPLYWAVAVRLPDHVDRDAVLAKMENEGIDARPGFYPVSVLPVLDTPPLPASERLGRSVLVLPTYVGMTATDIGRVCHSLARCLGR